MHEELTDKVKEGVDYLVQTYRTGLNEEMLERIRGIHQLAREYPADKSREMEQLRSTLRMYCMMKNLGEERLYAPREEHKEPAVWQGMVRKAVAIATAFGLGTCGLLYLTRTETRNVNAAQDMEYRVQKGDTLQTISERYTKDKRNWRKLKEYNRLAGDKIFVNQKLRIPKGHIR
ncbi:MAG: LysM peptidoglycan-binding domain-containing protein [Candidatus Woesearchaeota archaeon]